LTIDGATNALGSSQDLLDVPSKVLGERFWTHFAGDIDDLVKRDVAGVLDVLLLLSIAWGFLESLDNKCGSSGDNVDFGLSVLDRKLDSYP